MSCFELYCSLALVIMFSSKLGIFALLATLTVVTAVKLPSYIKQCKISDPNLNECIKGSAGPAVVKLLFGDESLNIPDLSKTPLQDQKYIIDGITYEISNIKTDSSMDLAPVHANMTFGTSPTFEITMHLSTYIWSGDFKAAGTFLNKNIQEQGHINITFVDNTYKYVRILEEENINGETHYKVKESYTTTSIGKTLYKPYALTSNGEKLSDDERQALIDTLPKLQNSAEKYIGLICGDLVTFVLNAVFKAVPRKEIFAA